MESSQGAKDGGQGGSRVCGVIYGERSGEMV